MSSATGALHPAHDVVRKVMAYSSQAHSLGRDRRGDIGSARLDEAREVPNRTRLQTAPMGGRAGWAAGPAEMGGRYRWRTSYAERVCNSHSRSPEEET